jgi:hypothetical protein
VLDSALQPPPSVDEERLALLESAGIRVRPAPPRRARRLSWSDTESSGSDRNNHSPVSSPHPRVRHTARRESYGEISHAAPVAGAPADWALIAERHLMRLGDVEGQLQRCRADLAAASDDAAAAWATVATLGVCTGMPWCCACC